MHTEEKPFKCLTCQKSFSHLTWKNINIHVHIHTGERRFKCSQCPKSYDCLSLLQRHLQTHEDKIHFRCVHHSKFCQNSSKLNIHKCSQCPNCFSQLSQKKIKCLQCQNLIKIHLDLLSIYCLLQERNFWNACSVKKTKSGRDWGNKGKR